MRDQTKQDAEERHWRVAGLLRTSAGTVGLLIAIVLIAQAGLVYVAVDQIGTNEDTTVVPARHATSPRAPISVDASEQERAPAPVVTREIREIVETGEPGTPTDTGLERARERAEPGGVAPPLTGNEPPASDRRETPSPRAAEPVAEPEDQSPGRSERAASDSPSDAPASEEATSAPPHEDSGDEPSETGPGASGDTPPGRGGDNPGNGTGGDSGKDKGKG